jgi:hypothetical protein
MKIKRILFLLAAVTIFISVGTGAWAADNGIMQTERNTKKIIGNQIVTPYWQNTDIVDTQLSFSGAKAITYARVIGKAGVTKITATVTLQRKNASGTLTTVKTWSGLEALGEELVFNDSYYVVRGYTYRLTISAKVYKGTGYESVSLYDERYCK